MAIKFLNTVAVDTDVLYVDTTNDRVGIGTDSPTEKLHVDGNARVTGAYYDSGNTPGTANQLLTSTATGTAWIDPSTIVAEAATLVVIACKNTSGATIAQGTPVYQTGTVGATATIEIAPADALISANKLPAIGLLQTALNNNGFGFVVITGELTNFTTSPIDGVVPTTGDKIFVKSGGGLTLTKPTGEGNGIQNMGLVGKVSGGNSGSITVSSIMRTNDVPNLPEGRIWVGDGNTLVSDTVYLDEPNGRMGIGTTSPAQNFVVADATNGNGIEFVPGATATFQTYNRGTSSYNNLNIDTARTQVRSIDYTSFHNGSGYPERMRITSAGNVGIGTTDPGAKLHVHQTGSGTNNSIITEDDARKIFIGRDSIKATDLSDNPAQLYIQQHGGNATFGNDLSIGGNLTLTTNSRYLRTEDSAGATTRLLGINGSNNTYIGPIDAYAGGSIFYGVSANVSSHTLYTGASARLHVNSSGNVGIGTTSPTQKLHVVGASNFQGAIQVSGGTFVDSTRRNIYLNSFAGGDGNGIFFRDGFTYNASITVEDHNGSSADGICISGYDGVSFSTGSNSKNERMRIATNGNVGIGTTSPGYPLEVKSASPFVTTNSTGTGNSGFAMLVNAGSNGVGVIATDNGGSLTFDNGATGGAQSEKMRITSSGNVGIGTTNPTSGIHVNTPQSAARFISSQGTGLEVQGGGNSQPIASFKNTAASEKVRISSTGNVGIGTTSPGAKLEVNGTIDVNDSGDRVFVADGSDGTFSLGDLDGLSDEAQIVGDANTIKINNGGSTTLTSTFNNRIGIGTTAPSQKLHVAGNMRLQNQLYDSTNSLGTNNQVLTKVSAGTQWKDAPVNAQMPNNTAAASAANVGTIRYRSTSNTSFVDMSMQTGATTYTWVNIVSNFW